MRRTELINPTRCQVVGRSEPLARVHLDACFRRKPKGAIEDDERIPLISTMGPSLFQRSLGASTWGRDGSRMGADFRLTPFGL